MGTVPELLFAPVLWYEIRHRAGVLEVDPAVFVVRQGIADVVDRRGSFFSASSKLLTISAWLHQIELEKMPRALFSLLTQPIRRQITDSPCTSV